MTTSAGWGVQLLGHPFDLGDWQRSFKPPFDPWVVSQKDRFILRWSEFEDCRNAEEVRDVATPLVERLNGIMYVTFDARPVRFDGIVRFSPDGTQNPIMLAESGAYEARGRSLARGVGAAQDWLALSEKHDLLADAVVYLSRGEWFDIYKAVECLKHEFGGEAALKAHNWISPGELDNMKQTANSHRHYTKGHHKPPPSPVTLPEARQLLRTLVRRAFEERLIPASSAAR